MAGKGKRVNFDLISFTIHPKSLIILVNDVCPLMTFSDMYESVNPKSYKSCAVSRTGGKRFSSSGKMS